MNNLLNFLVAVVILALLGHICGCGDSPTEPKIDTYQLSGTLEIGESQNPALASVVLFLAPEDDQLDQALSTYPSIGFPDYNMMTFDPHTLDPVQSIFPNETGIFSFENLPKGRYFVSAFLDGFACPTPVFVDLKSSASVGTLELTAEQEISGNILTDTIWEAGSVFRIVGDILVIQNTTLTIEAGTQILFDGDYAIKIFGKIDVIGNPSYPVYFRLHDNYYSSGADWDGVHIEFGAEECNFSRAVFQSASSGIVVTRSPVQISECFFDAPDNEGISFSAGPDGRASHNIFRDGLNGLSSELGSPELTNNLILRMARSGINLADSSEALIYNNGILNCSVGISSNWFTNPNIHHNLISGGSHAIYAERGFTAALEYNVFMGQTEKTIYFNIGFCYPSPFENNNFVNAPQNILFVTGNIGLQSGNILAPSNFWDGAIDDISLRIIDGHDRGSPENPIGIVAYNPILETPVAEAGI